MGKEIWGARDREIWERVTEEAGEMERDSGQERSGRHAEEIC